MATSLKVSLRALVEAVLESGIGGVAGGAQISALNELQSFANGTASGQMDLVYYGERTLAATANETLDLAGSLKDLFNNTLSFVKVKLIAVKVTTTTAGALEFGPNSSNGAGIGGFWKAAANKNRINNNGSFLLLYDPDGFTVTASTADLLYAENTHGSNAVTYRILIGGTSA